MDVQTAGMVQGVFCLIFFLSGVFGVFHNLYFRAYELEPGTWEWLYDESCAGVRSSDVHAATAAGTNNPDRSCVVLSYDCCLFSDIICY